MRIVIDARTIADHFPGIGRYTYNLLGALTQIEPRHEYIALTTSAVRNTRYELGTLAVEWAQAAARPLTFAEQWQIPLLLRNLKADLFHATYYVRPYLGLPCPVVTTLYDTIPRRFPQAVSWRARMLFDTLNYAAVASSQHIMAISQSTRRDLIEAYSIPKEKISVTPLAADPLFQPQTSTRIAQLRATYDLPEQYVLTLAANKAHKNIAGLLATWQTCRNHMPMPLLVIAGHHDPQGTDLAQLTSMFAANEIRLLQNIPSSDMPALYSGATAFIYPSLYEGFGLPVVEALACGTAVVCSNTSSMPEVAGNAAILADPADSEAFAHAILSLLQNDELRTQLRQAGPQQAARFSWADTARLTLGVYGTVGTR